MTPSATETAATPPVAQAAADPRFAAVGALPGAMGAVILPTDSLSSSDALAAAAALRDGRLDALPAAWGFLVPGEPDAVPASTPATRATLAGDANALLRCADEAHAAGDADAAALFNSVAYRCGGNTRLPAAETVADPRVRAFLLATLAHDRAADGDPNGAAADLHQAASLVERLSPAAAARYTGEAAAVLSAAGPVDARTMLELDRAAERLAALPGRGHHELRGELLMTRAAALMDLAAAQPAALPQAVQCYQKATQALPRRTHPLPYAVCHLNIAVAYLSMPMNEHADRLRGAIAVQSLREALEVFTPEDHPRLWASATLNLANSLQHLPSAHLGTNLAESVTHYESLLAHAGTLALDDAACARVEANLGNALAHLARFDEARPRLVSARAAFAALADADAVAGIGAVLAELDARAAAANGGTPA